MTPARRPRSPSNGSQWFSAHTSPSFPSCPLPPKCMSSSSYRGVSYYATQHERAALVARGKARCSSGGCRCRQAHELAPNGEWFPDVQKGLRLRACVRGGESRERGEPGRPTRSLVCHQGLAYSPGGARDRFGCRRRSPRVVTTACRSAGAGDRCRAPRPCDALLAISIRC